MSSVHLVSLIKQFGPSARAVDDVNLDIEQGQLFSLLGSSGCGKTTTLRCVAGLELPSSGQILFDDVDVAQTPPYDRDCGMVFQNYALFPHMSVADNVAYGLMARRYRQAGLGGKLATLFRTVTASLNAQEKDQVANALELVELGGLGDRRPQQLSGGQQQRVALARALVTRPRVLLFDEPLGALDAKLRVKVREEIRRIQQQAGITTLYVTHDQEEALAISDRIAVMNKGKVVQMGTPEDLYLRPRSRFLADFIGLSNIYSAQGQSGELAVTEGQGWVLKSEQAVPAGACAVALRPEGLKLLKAGQSASNETEGKVVLKMFMGTTVKYLVEAKGLTLHAAVPQAEADTTIENGQSVRLGCDARDVLVLSE